MKNALRNLTSLLLHALSVHSAAAQQRPVGIFDGSQDVGKEGKFGATAYAPATQQYVVLRVGRNDHDELQYVYKKIKGDFLLTPEPGSGTGIARTRTANWAGWCAKALRVIRPK